MKSTLKRTLACLLSLTLLVTCAVSGLVLPVVAESSTEGSAVVNLITNGDFESGIAGWEASASKVKDGIGYGGSRGLEYDTHGCSNFATYTQAGGFDLDPNSTYRVTYRYKGAPVCLYRSGGTYTDVSEFSIKTATRDYGDEWMVWTVYFTTGANPSMDTFRFGRTSSTTSGSTFIDDLTMEKLTPETNQIVGGEFDSYADAWMFSIGKNCGLEIVDDPINGAGNTVAHFTKDTDAAYYNRLWLRPGRRYELSFRHYGASLSYQIAKTVGVDANGAPLGTWKKTGAHNEWTNISFVFDTFNQQGVTSNGMYQFCIGIANGAYIDDVVLKELPATEGLALEYSALSLRTGKRMKIGYTLTPADATLQGGALKWSTSNADVVQVTADGEVFVRGNAGQSATVTLSNACMSASCTITIPTNDPVVDAFFADTGIGDYTVSHKNYDGIIGGESRYAALTDAQREYISELLPIGRDYLDLLVVAKEKQATFASEFVTYYATDAAGAAYTEVTFDNCLWIAAAKAEWGTMSASTKALVNAEVLAASGMTFDKMLADAVALVPVTNPNDRPGGAVTGDDEPEDEPEAEQPTDPVIPEDTVEPGVITPSGSTSITLSGEWYDSVTIPDYAYSIAVVGDTQVITDRSPEGLKKIYDWILDNKDEKNIQFVAGLGDITETNSVAQWEIAAEQILRLKGQIPFSIVNGNHDVFNGSTANMNAYLPADVLFEGMSSDRYGLYEAGCVDNTYQLFEVGEVKYVMIALEFGPSPDVLAWAGEVCDAYPDRNIILTTHAYLDGKGYVMDLNHSGSPHLKGGYATTYGTTIWEELVSTHDNIVLAFSGHVTADKAEVRQEIGKYGQVVTQMVSNPQTIDDQRELTGMVTMLYFSEDGTQMTVSDYSTIKGQYYGTPVTVTVDKAQHRHKASTDVWSGDDGSHWFACACGERAEEAPHAYTAWELTSTDGVQVRMCAICEYEQRLTVPALYTDVTLHRAGTHNWQYNETEHWLECGCGEEMICTGEHNWTAWEKTGTAPSVSIFKDDDGILPSGFIEGGPIENGVGVLDPNEDELAKELGDAFAAEVKANIIGDFEKDGDKMVHVSSFTIINDIVYMTYYANTASALEDAKHQEARLAYCPLDNPDDLTVVKIQKVGDRIEGQEVTMLYDTILMNKDEEELYIMWTAKTSQYYRFYCVFDIATGTLGPIRVNRFKVGDITNDFSISGIRKALKGNGIDTRYMLSDIGIMQKISTRVEDGVTYYYTGAYSWQFNCIIKSADFITWEFVAAPDFVNQSEYENAAYVLGDKVYYFVRQYDGNSTFDKEGNKIKCNTGFLTYYDLSTETWAAPLEITDCQSRSDFIYYGGQLYLIHAPKNRNGIGLVRVDQENLANSKAVIVADMGSSCFYPFVKVYGDEAYISYTVNRLHIRLSKVDLRNYFESDGTPSEGPTGDVVIETVVEEPEHDLDVWERFCPCGASEYTTLPMGIPVETDSDDNLIYGKVDQAISVGGGEAAEKTVTVPVQLKAGNRYALRFVTNGTNGIVSIPTVSGVSVTTTAHETWRIYQYLFVPATDLTSIDINVKLKGATRMNAVNFQILNAPQDGTFNLFPGSSMDVESSVFDYNGGTGTYGPYRNGSTLEADPVNGESNKVLKLLLNTSNFTKLTDTLKGWKCPDDMLIEITFRRNGTGLRLQKSFNNMKDPYIGTQGGVTPEGEWRDYTWYLDPKSDLGSATNPGSAFLNFRVHQSYGTATYYEDKACYIDDLIIREVPRVESVSFKDGVVKVDAASGAHDISNQLIVTPEHACPADLKDLTWSMTGGTTNRYNTTTKKFDGTEFEAVTLNGTTLTVANNSGNGYMYNLWSLANVKPIITVSVNESLTVSAPVEWVYADTVFDIDLDTYIPGKAEKYVVYENGESGNKVLSFPVSSGFQAFFKQEMMLKPNSTYLMSFRQKVPAGSSAIVDVQIGSWVDITEFGKTTKALILTTTATNEWVTRSILIQTGDSPATDLDYSMMWERNSGSGSEPILIDDFRLELVPDDYSRVIGGTFEFAAPAWAYYQKIIANGLGEVVQGDAVLGNTSKVLKLNPGIDRGTNTAIMNLDYLRNNTTYKMTFRHKGDKLLFNAAGGNNWAATINNVGVTANFEATDKWVTRTVYFTTGSDITNNGNWTSSYQFGTPNATAPVYLDDITITEVKGVPHVKAINGAANRPGTLTLSSGGESGTHLPNAKAGDTITVTLKPNSGYIPVPGSLIYTTASGKTVKVLNKSIENAVFGSGNGLTYEFTMPSETVTLDAKFISVADTSFAMDTVGTALRVGQGGDNYDGIRFLTRMYLGTFDENADTLTVKYGGQQYTVEEFGSLLKRTENATELTVANVEASTATGVNRMWKSVAYKAGGNMSLVDYTDGYVDFSVVMLRGSNVSEEAFNARSYTARGYIKLKAADGTIVTVECANQLTNSIDTTAPLL